MLFHAAGKGASLTESVVIVTKMDVFTAANNEEKKRICCIRPKTWTRVVGVLELVRLGQDF